MGKNNIVKHSYVCDGIQKVFEFQFEIFSKVNVKVFVDNVLQKSGVEIVSFDDKKGGQVIFDYPPIKNKILTIVRELDFSRICNFQTGGLFRAEDLNLELNYTNTCLNQLNDILNGTIRLSYCDKDVNPELPKSKAGHAIVWNEKGDGFENSVCDLTEQVNYVEDCVNTVEGIYNDLTDIMTSSLDVGILGLLNNMLAILKTHYPNAFLDFKKVSNSGTVLQDYGNVGDVAENVIDNGSV